MRALDNKRILLGVTGGIACYKAAALARLLTQEGAIVDVVMTRSASEFVGATTFQALTGREVHSELFGSAHALDHIRLARRADLIIVAPGTADFMARMVHGRANDLLAAAVLASSSPVVVAPAMNDHMWAKPATQRNVAQLRADGVHVVNPETGPLAAGEGEGPGRMAEPETILAHAARLLSRNSSLRGKHIVVTAGPTREAIDPIRFISNHSSGKMGVALARAAWLRGAEVTLIGGGMSVEPPNGVSFVSSQSTDEMAAAVKHALVNASALIMAAAPADFRPSHSAQQKLEKNTAPMSLELTGTTDILASSIGSRPADCVIVGFALETTDVQARARKKLAGKKMDLIVVNDATEPGAGFGVDTNRVTLISKDGSELELPLLSKDDVSEIILDKVEALISGGS